MTQDDSSRSEINYLKEAAKLQYNWIALAGIAGFALLSGSGLPLLLGAGLELMYLSVVPNNSRFQRLGPSPKDEDNQRRGDVGLAPLFEVITPEMGRPYAALGQVGRG